MDRVYLDITKNQLVVVRLYKACFIVECGGHIQEISLLTMLHNYEYIGEL